MDERDEKPEETPETDLDDALVLARRHPAQPNDFYDLFLNVDLYLPVRISGKETGSWQRAGVKERFHPYFLPKGKLRVVPVFDRLERLQRWSEGRAFDYVQLRCHLLLGMISADVGLVLNPGTSFAHSFSPEVLEKLRRAMRSVSPT